MSSGDNAATVFDAGIPGIRLEIAAKRHETQLLNFMLDYFRKEEPITSAVGTTRDDAKDFYVDLRDSGLRGPYSFVAIDRNTNELVGCRLNEIVDCSPQKKSAPPIVYSNERANKVSGFVDDLSEGLFGLVPSAGRMMKFIVIAVHPKWMRKGLGGRMTAVSIELARNQRCDCVVAAATALRSQSLFTKFGFETIREIKYDSYKKNDKIVFHYLHDGATSGKLMVKWL